MGNELMEELILTGEALAAKGLWYLFKLKPWTNISLYLALSFETPDSVYDKCLPSRSLILGDVIGGPSGDPTVFGGGGRAVW